MSQEPPPTSTTTTPSQIQNSPSITATAVTATSTTASVAGLDPGAGAPSTSTRPIVNLVNVMQTQSQQNHNRVQDVRVDNWGNYCLQRLQVMYDRGDFCDLTLQFHNNQILKVHRVVVNLCTEYFANLERIFGLTNGLLVLPKDIEYQAMVTIVKFFYTGKLEVRGNQFNDIYRTVKLMNITILTKLLEAHARKPIMQAKKEMNRPIVFKQAVEIGRPLPKGQVQVQIQSCNQSQSSLGMTGGTTVVTGSTKTLTMAPGGKLPPGVKTKTVLARVQPQTMRVATQQSNVKNVVQKKLPIWKERKYSPAANSDPLMLEKWPPKDEPPRPTRFEWLDPDEDPPYVTAAAHTLMEKQKAAATARRAEDIFDAVKNQNQGIKRSMSIPPSSICIKSEAGGSFIKQKIGGPPLTKVAKLEVPQSAPIPEPSENLINESDDINLTEETVEEVVSTSVRAVGEFSTLPSTSSSGNHSSITVVIPSSNMQVNNPGQCVINLKNTSSPCKPVTSSISSLAKTTPGQPKVEKSVRFAPEVEKENKNKTTEIIVPTELGDPLSNHSKIISEVLKKYPDLVKENKNIKLKIVQKGAETSPNKEAKSKVSYIVLKSTSAPDSSGAVVLKKPTQTTNKTFWDSDKLQKKPPSGAENTAGPWLCGPCGGGDATPMEFESYYLYRRHLVEVHGERIDARICEYCGQKASKRNLLLYHLYTKHGVPPPKNCTFPHCDRCDYVALSESLLSKHKQGHDISKEFSCTICNASFKSSAALQGHMAANLHRNKDTKVYECPYCRKPFVRNINLKAHIRSLHKDVARIEEMEDPRLPPDDSLANRPVAIVHAGTGKKRQFPSILAGPHGRPHGSSGSGGVLITGDADDTQRMEQVSLVTADGSTIEILHGIDPSMQVPVSLVPSSEAEALTNVASSIAASLGLEAQGTHGGPEYVTGVGSDGTPAVYIMDSSQTAVEVDMSSVGVGVAADGSMILDGDDPGCHGQFFVQDIHGNSFRKLTGIDDTGKQVIFFQMNQSGQVTMAPAAILDNAIHMATDSVSRYDDASQSEGPTHFNFVPESEAGVAHTTFSVQNDHMYLDPQKCSVFVSSGMTMPVTVSSDAGGQATQVLLSTNSHEGTQIIEMVSTDQEHHQQHVVDETVMAQHHQHQHQHQQVEQQQHQLSLAEEEVHQVVHDEMGQPIQELHIVLDQGEVELDQTQEEEIETEEDQAHEEAVEGHVHAGQIETQIHQVQEGEQIQVQDDSGMEIVPDPIVPEDEGELQISEHYEQTEQEQEVVEEIGIDHNEEELQEQVEVHNLEGVSIEETDCLTEDVVNVGVDLEDGESHNINVVSADQDSMVTMEDVNVDESNVETQELDTQMIEEEGDTQPLENEESNDTVTVHVSEEMMSEEQIRQQEEDMELVQHVEGETVTLTEDVSVVIEEVTQEEEIHEEMQTS